MDPTCSPRGSHRDESALGLHPPAGLHQDARGPADRAGHRLVSAARGRPLPQARLPVRVRDDHPARGERRGDGDLGHQADRGRHQHDRAGSTSCARRPGRGSRGVIVQFALEKSPTSPRRRSTTRSTRSSRTCPRGTDPPIIDKFDERRDAGHHDRRLGQARPPRGDRDRPQADQGASRDGPRRRRGDPGRRPDGGRSTSSSTPTSCRRSACRSRTSGGPWSAQNLELPGGRVDQGDARAGPPHARPVSTPPSEFNDLIVANRDGYPIRIRDVGRAEDSVEEPRTLARLDGVNAVSLVVQKQSGTNTVEVVRLIKERLATIAQGAARRHHASRSSATSRVSSTGVDRGGEVPPAAGRRCWSRLTILLFIRDWRTTLIATLAIPTSIIPTFLFMDSHGVHAQQHHDARR